MSEEFSGIAELLLNSVPVPCVTPSASSPQRISGPLSTLSKVSGSDDFKPCTLNVRGLRDSSKCARLFAELTNLSTYCCSARDSLHLRCEVSGAGERL